MEVWPALQCYNNVSFTRSESENYRPATFQAKGQVHCSHGLPILRYVCIMSVLVGLIIKSFTRSERLILPT